MVDNEPIPNSNLNEILLPSLPFTYVQTDDPTKAEIRDFGYAFKLGNEPAKVRSMEEVLLGIKRKKEDKNWYTTEYWRKKGIPQEQIELNINGRTITVFNYNRETPFTDEHLTKAIEVFSKIASNFPQISEEIRWLLIDDLAELSVFGDPEKYPVNGTCVKQWKAFRMYPRGMTFIPHRIEKATNFEGTLVHELSHLLEKEFVTEWKEKFSWDFCADSPDEWEVRLTPDGRYKKHYNKKTGEMAPAAQYPHEPEQSVNYYAKINMEEDIAESITCYLIDPEKLKRISPAKYEIISRHDKRLKLSVSASQRIEKEKIEIPKPEQETVYYYIIQPEVKPVELPAIQDLLNLSPDQLEKILISITREQIDTVNDTSDKTDKRRKELQEYEKIIQSRIPQKVPEPIKQDRITKQYIEGLQRRLQERSNR